jgi:hypothetical protein
VRPYLGCELGNGLVVELDPAALAGCSAGRSVLDERVVVAAVGDAPVHEDAHEFVLVVLARPDLRQRLLGLFRFFSRCRRLATLFFLPRRCLVRLLHRLTWAAPVNPISVCGGVCVSVCVCVCVRVCVI